MIITEKDFAKLRGNVAMADGCFDPLHNGHVAYFQEAGKTGLPVVCNVQSDAYIKRVKNRNPLLTEEERTHLIDALRDVQYVFLCTTSTDDVLRKLKPKYFVKGKDWEHKGLPPADRAACDENGIEVRYVDAARNSSTKVMENLLQESCKKFVNGNVSKFETFVLGQKQFDAAYYNQQYFQDEWRSHANSYSIDKRREIEGKNPENIKRVFAPKRALDFGCGPGALMLFLHELGVDVYGIDFSAEAQKEAPEAIRGRITVGPITQYRDFGMDFDLVICRETLEHLTVLQVQKAVEVMAATTSKFIYVTTRFHPNPPTLLDVTDQPDVDPSHITLLHKEYLRLLFVMQGMKSRPDLEQALDWKNFGRVLAFEKVRTPS